MTQRKAELGAARTVATSLGELDVHEAGSGRDLVFVHGIIANADIWADVVGRLSDRYRCISIDLPLGAHARPAREDAELTPESAATALTEACDALGLEKPVIVANDTGGAIVQFALARRPDLASAVVLTPCDTFSNFLPWSLRYTQLLARVPGGAWMMCQALRIPLVRASPIAFGWLTKHRVDPELWRSFLGPGRESRAVRRDLGRFLRGISARRLKEASGSLGAVKAPVLLAWCDSKRVFPVSGAERLRDVLPDARIEVIPDSRAFVQLDQPEAVARHIDQFVAALA